MPKNITKSLREYMSKIRNPQSSHVIQLPSKKWILTGCRHPRTPSIDIDSLSKIKNTHHATNQDEEAMLADIDRFLFENFKSLFFEDRKETTTTNNHREEKSPKLPVRFEEYSSKVDTESTSKTRTTLVMSSTDSDGTQERGVPSNCVVVLANSTNPIEDFRKSMEGVVATLKNSENVDWEFMAELLFCHMKLNDKKSHKFILNAFFDVVSAMRRPLETSPTTTPKPRSVRTIRIGKEVHKKTKEVTLEFGSAKN